MRGLFLVSQTVLPAAEIGSISSQVFDYLKFLLVLAGILVLAYVALRFWMPRMMGVKNHVTGAIQVVTRFPLEPKKTLYVIKTGAEFFLIGTSESEIHHLTALAPDKIEPFLQQEEKKPAPQSEFSRLLKSFRGPRVS